MDYDYDRLYKKSSIPGLEKALILQYGENQGRLFYRLSGIRLSELVKTVNDRDNEVVRHHLNDNILPVAACYQVLRENNIGCEQAKKLVTDVMHNYAQKGANIFRMMSNIPFFYSVFRKMCRKTMKQNYPCEGWDMRWQQDDKQGMGFDCHRCIYVDATQELGCPEICESFCQNDDILYGALKPKVLFVRTKTLANGGDCCDFRLLNGKHMHKRQE